MPPSRLIIELNRCFDPNPFNTGPPIPQPSQRFGPEDIPWTISPISNVEAERLLHDASTPDLASSPSSSVSSLALEDEEIRKIFSAPRYLGLDGANAGGNIAPQSIRKDELNPHAVPFVPFFAIYSGLHNPISNWVDPNVSYTPPPLEFGVKPQDFVYPQLPDAEQSPILESSPHPRTVSLPPLHPPGFPHPPIHSTPQPGSLNSNPQCPPPQYLPVLLDALKPGRTTREREVLARVIVNMIDDWNMDSLLELAERIGMEASNPTPDPVDGQEVPQTPVQDDPLVLSALAGREQGRETKVAELGRALYVHFDQHHRDVGQFFTWNLRETVLTRFINYWDCAKPDAITSTTRPSVQYVQSALTLCRSVAALFRQDIISREHISMCISILMKNLVSVEHVEAVANLVLGCGLAFWKPASVAPGNSPNIPSTVPADSLLLQQGELGPAKLQVKEHVTSFLNGLETNVLGRRLTEDDSIAGQPWEKGRLLVTIQEVVDAVKYWEAVIMTGR